MPIRFRCDHCNRLLGIARRKAGSQVICPHCGFPIIVPDPPTEAATEAATELMDIDALLLTGLPNPTGVPQPENSESPASTTSTLGPPAAANDEPPLFERELESIFRSLSTAPSRADDRSEKPPPTSGMDALSLAPDPGHIVLTPQKATLLAVAAFALVVLSFVAGYLAGGGK